MASGVRGGVARCWGERLAVPAAAFVGAWAGAVPRAENLTHRVLGMVEALPAPWALRPFHMPPPLDAMSLRPWSVLLLKGYLFFRSPDQPVPTGVVFLKAFACLLLFGWGARAWWRARGEPGVATWAASLAIAVPPVAYGAWFLPELDLLGAGATLWALAILGAREPPDRARSLLAALLLVLAFGLKESTALVQFAFLGAALLAARRQRRVRRRLGWAIALGGVWWGVMAMPILFGPRTDFGALPLQARLPMLVHHLVQLLALGSPAVGPLLLARAAAAGVPRRWRAPAAAVPVALLAALLLSPLPVRYSHYEWIYLGPRSYGVFHGLVLAAGLLAAATRGRGTAASLAARTVIAVYAALTLAGLLAPSAREDLAARVFAAVAPLLLGAGFLAARDLLRGSAPGGPSWAGRGSVLLLLLTLGTWPPLAGYDLAAEERARMQAGLAGRRVLAAQDLRGGVVLFNNYVEWLGPEELAALGARGAGEARFVQVPAWLEPARWKGAFFISEPPPPLADLLAGRRPAWLFWSAARSRAPAEARAPFLVDLSGSRRPYGLFTPILPGGPNRVEDALATLWRPGEPPLLRWAGSHGLPLVEVTRAYVQVPRLLTEIPRRLLAGMPLAEPRLHEVRILRVGG